MQVSRGDLTYGSFLVNFIAINHRSIIIARCYKVSMSPNLTYYLTFFFNLNKQKIGIRFFVQFTRGTKYNLNKFEPSR